MIALITLSLYAFSITTSFGAEDDFNPLGMGVYLPKFNLLGYLDDTGIQILNPSALQQCTKRATKDVSSRDFYFYKDTRSFYSSVATTTGLETNLQSDFSLGFTLDHASKSVSGSTRKIAGSLLLIKASYRQDTVDKSCLLDQKNFDESFLSNFQRLPTMIHEPWEFNSWKGYDMFLKQYGSHVVTSTVLGSSINQAVFAESFNSYSERDFQVKACLSLGYKLFRLSACSGITKSEKSRVSSMSFKDDLVIRGGTAETRNKLLKHRTNDLIEQFMNEAKTTSTAVQFSFTSLWDILEPLYAGKDTDNYARALNLANYYLGFLNYRCDKISQGGQVLQMFNTARGSSPTLPKYECSLAPEGCQKDGDCRYKFLKGCYCKGESCIRYREEILDTGKTRMTAYTNSDKWKGHGCKLHSLKCFCHPSLERTTVWTRVDKRRH